CEQLCIRCRDEQLVGILTVEDLSRVKRNDLNSPETAREIFLRQDGINFRREQAAISSVELCRDQQADEDRSESTATAHTRILALQSRGTAGTRVWAVGYWSRPWLC